MTHMERQKLRWRIDHEKMAGRHWAERASDALVKSSEHYRKATELLRELEESEQKPTLRVVE